MGKDANVEAGVIRYSEHGHHIKRNTLYIDHLVLLFMEENVAFQPVNFEKFCTGKMTTQRCREVFNETMLQSLKAEWYYQRYGRISASRIYE